MTRGYTLLEILVVMLLLGLVSGLVIPRLDRLMDSIRIAYEQDEVMDAIAGLVFTAYSRGEGFVLDSYPSDSEAPLPLELPEGWMLETSKPILFHANGVCDGGTIRISNETQVTEMELHPPLCRPGV